MRTQRGESRVPDLKCHSGHRLLRKEEEEKVRGRAWESLMRRLGNGENSRGQSGTGLGGSWPRSAPLSPDDGNGHYFPSSQDALRFCTE